MRTSRCARRPRTLGVDRTNLWFLRMPSAQKLTCRASRTWHDSIVRLNCLHENTGSCSRRRFAHPYPSRRPPPFRHKRYWRRVHSFRRTREWRERGLRPLPFPFKGGACSRCISAGERAAKCGARGSTLAGNRRDLRRAPLRTRDSLCAVLAAVSPLRNQQRRRGDRGVFYPCSDFT